MSQRSTRRQFLTSASAAAVAAASLQSGPRCQAEPRRDWRVRYDDEIEPLVRLIEETERERCVEVIGEQILRGLSYRRFMSAVFLAGLRNGGDTGYYHCIYVIHAANQLAARSFVRDQLLPLFGAMDLFKGWQARRVGEPSHFGMQPLPKRLQSAENAVQYFQNAVRDSDPDGAEAATVALSEAAGRDQIFRVLATQALNAGAVHRSILVSNCWRVLGAMNWDHYVPTLRAMARMLADDTGLRESWFIPLREQAEATYGELPPNWSGPQSDDDFTRELLSILRTGDTNASVELVVAALFRGEIQSRAIWNAVHLAAAESMIRRGDGNALHENTTLNALHYAFRTIGDEDDRLMILLSVVKLAAEAYARSGMDAAGSSILHLSTTEIPSSSADAVNEICSTSVDSGAVKKAYTLAQTPKGVDLLAGGIRDVVVAKARNDAHPYKIAAANQEDCRYVSPQWRPYLAAAPIGLQRGGDADVTDNPDSSVILQAREILSRL